MKKLILYLDEVCDNILGLLSMLFFATVFAFAVYYHPAAVLVTLMVFAAIVATVCAVLYSCELLWRQIIKWAKR